MSILIKGIPLGGYEISIMKDGERYRARVDGIWCDVEEVPTPHGRLGDLDALVKTLEQNRLCYVSDIDDESFELGTNRAIDAVRNANTIIEEEGTE